MAYLRAILVGLVLVFVAVFGVFVVEPLIGRMGDESQFVFVATGFALGGILCLLYRVFARMMDGPRKANAAPNPFLEQRRIDERKRVRQGRSSAYPEPPRGGATIHTLKSVAQQPDSDDHPRNKSA